MVSSKTKQIDPETTGGGWRQNDWKVKRHKQGTPTRVNLPRESEAASPTGTRMIWSGSAGGEFQINEPSLPLSNKMGKSNYGFAVDRAGPALLLLLLFAVCLCLP